MSEQNYQHLGRFIYGAHRYGRDVSDVENWMADDLGVARAGPGDSNAAGKRDLYLAFFAKYTAEDTLQVRFPRQTGHPFHGKLDTWSSANWTLIPQQTGHPVQRKLDTDSAPNWTV